MDIQQIMKKAQDLQGKMEKAQSTMQHQKIPGASAGGGVKVVLTGQGKVHDIQQDWTLLQEGKIFSPAFLTALQNDFSEDFNLLKDLIIAAANNAKDKLDGAVTEIMKSLGLSPDIFNQEDNE
jgi:DNA-binding protein YbaB